MRWLKGVETYNYIYIGFNTIAIDTLIKKKQRLQISIFRKKSIFVNISFIKLEIRLKDIIFFVKFKNFTYVLN